jgi:uncharacterized protein YbjT (DUF2867 family)
MRIKMLTLQAGPAGVRSPGSVYDVPPVEAEALIAGGYAVKVEKEKTEAAPAVTGKPRTATRAAGRTATKAAAGEPAPEPDEGDGE